MHVEHLASEQGQPLGLGFPPKVAIEEPMRETEPNFAVAEWGFALGSAFWGTGVFEEAAALVLSFAFEHLGVHRLEARAVVRNGRGTRALQKMGAVQEGVLRRSFETVYDEPLQDLHFTAITDTRYYAHQGIPCLCFGARAKRMHGFDECVELESLRKTTRTLALFIADWCGVRS